MAAILGDRFYWWIDPVGAIALAVYTIVNWSGTVLENAGMALKFLPYTMHKKSSLFMFGGCFCCSFTSWTVGSSRSTAETYVSCPKARPEDQACRHGPCLHVWGSILC